MSRVATVFTHRRPGETGEALRVLVELAREADVELHVGADEVAKHDLGEQPGVVSDGAAPERPDLCVALGGDGTILTALRRYAGREVPVFAVNYGQVGFLATTEPADVREGLRRALSGDFEVMRLPVIGLADSGVDHVAINDVSLHRKPGGRVAHLSYAVGGEELGRVRCDGLVIATPAGSTGYNLANGGPLLAWGVEGFVVSFIAPHSLVARALVVAPGDVITVQNASRDEAVDVSVDGRPACELAPGQEVEAVFRPDQGWLAQLPGSTFYHRLREKFGLLSM